MPLFQYPLTCLSNPMPNLIDLSLWNEVNGIIEWRAATCRTLMTVVEIAISSNVNISTTLQWMSKYVA